MIQPGLDPNLRGLVRDVVADVDEPASKVATHRRVFNAELVTGSDAATEQKGGDQQTKREPAP
jgi:hypothetical protein